MNGSIWEVITEDFRDLPDLSHLLQITVRLFVATVLGGLLGFEREQRGKPAGLRTHMLTTLGSALFVLAPQYGGMMIADVSRVIQGVATGIGFIGAGTILKLTDQREIQGLTTATSIWMSAAIGVSVGLGRLGFAIVSAFFALAILWVLGLIETRLIRRNRD